MRQQQTSTGSSPHPKRWHLKALPVLSVTVVTLLLVGTGWLITAHVQARIGETGRTDIQLPRQTDFSRERALFLKAEAAIKANKPQEAQPLLAQLKHYPLRPYLDYLQLSETLSTAKREDIEAFFKQYPNSRLTPRLRSQWLRQLARQEQWQIFLAHYTPHRSTQMQCHHKSALLATGRTKEALAGAKDLWLVGKSQPKACDRIFAAWQQSTGFKSEYYSERAYLALKARQFNFAKFLAGKTRTKTDDARVKLWTELYRHPDRLPNKTLTIKNSFDQSLALMALERLLRRDLNAFEAQWRKYQDSVSTPSEDFAQFTHFVARWYSWHYYPDSWQWLTLADPDLKDRELLERRIRLALYTRDWAGVRDWIGALPLAHQAEDAWRYWRARAAFELVQTQALDLLTTDSRLPQPLAANAYDSDLMALHRDFVRRLYDPKRSFTGLTETHTPAQALAQIRADLAALAQTRGFYGFLASEILQQPLSLNHIPLDITDAERWRIEKRPGIQAALEWFRLERLTQARSAWFHDTRALPPKTKSIAAKVASEWGWHHQAIYTAASSSHKDDLVMRFPLGFFDQVYEQTIDQQIYADWTFALIRQESAFMHDARSPVGAMGLMQLMPGTAKLVSRKAGEKYPGNSALLTARTNIQFGTRYMASLFEQFKGNLLLATAGYNAGPHRAISWQHPTDPIPGDLWIETVPIEETRDYVKNIMTYQAIYRWHLGRPPRLSSSLEQVPPLSETAD